jgi:hypothetical protein
VAYAVGITIRTKTSRPHLRGVVVDTTSVAAMRTFEHLASPGESADQLHSLGQDLASELAAQDDIVAVIVREVGFAKAAGLTLAVKNRLRAEGICVAVARTVTSKVQVLDINAIAQLLGVSTADVPAHGASIATSEYVEPATAALAAMHL